MSGVVGEQERRKHLSQPGGGDAGSSTLDLRDEVLIGGREGRLCVSTAAVNRASRSPGGWVAQIFRKVSSSGVTSVIARGSLWDPSNHSLSCVLWRSTWRNAARISSTSIGSEIGFDVARTTVPVAGDDERRRQGDKPAVIAVDLIEMQSAAPHQLLETIAEP